MNALWTRKWAKLTMVLCGLCALALVGCGDDSVPGDSGAEDSAVEDSALADSSATDSATVDSATGDSATGDSGSIDSSVSDAATDAGTAGPCPATEPGDGTSCTRDGLACAYGDDPRVRCRPVATCTSGSWVVVTPTCSTLPPATCPATREDAAATTCTPDGAICAYGGLACTCTNCNSGPVLMCGGAPTWHCEAPNADPQCPEAIPRRGDACTKPDQMCSYGCEDGMARTCTDGVWVESTAPGGCPVSTRRAKRDIHYLSTHEADAVAQQVAGTRLATWEYIDPALQGRRHLGFILEDQPGSYAEDPEARMVDLYGYTSMLVANAQAQQRRIDELSRQVDALRSTVASCRTPTDH